MPANTRWRRQASVLITLAALSVATRVAHAQTVPQLRATEEMRISGDTESLVGFGALVVGRDGRIAFPQNQDGKVLVYSAAGRQLIAFGTKGAGPGEFNYLSGTMGWLGDTLWVFDFNNGRRHTFIGPDGKLIRTQSFATQTPYDPTPTPAGAKKVSLSSAHIDKMYADGTMLLRQSFGAMNPEFRSYDDQRFIVVNPAGDVLREVAKLPPPVGRIVVLRNGQFAGGGYVPFVGVPQHSVSGNGSRIAMLSTTTMSGANGSYDVTVVRSTGDTVFKRTYTFTGVRISQAAKDSILNQMIERGRVNTPEGRFPGEEFAKQAKEKMPDYYAPVTNIVAGDDDTTWLVLRELTPAVRVRALDARGNVIGDVVLKPNNMLVRATRTQLWVIEYDEDRTPSVVRYRVGQ